MEVVRCGYGKLEWTDGYSFEGYWINGQPIGIGVFKTQEKEFFEGLWALDKASGMSVFRQRDGVTGSNGKGIEVWSDGSYYLG